MKGAVALTEAPFSEAGSPDTPPAPEALGSAIVTNVGPDETEFGMVMLPLNEGAMRVPAVADAHAGVAWPVAQ